MNNSDNAIEFYVRNCILGQIFKLAQTLYAFLEDCVYIVIGKFRRNSAPSFTGSLAPHRHGGGADRPKL